MKRGPTREQHEEAIKKLQDENRILRRNLATAMNVVRSYDPKLADHLENLGAKP